MPVAVVRPSSTEDVATILRECGRAGQRVVIQGGLTGLAGGATPQAGELAISLERLTGIEEIDRAAQTMTVRAGTPLQVVQEAAADAGYLFPLDLGARGSCTIGGNIATNAGGNQVIRFGMMRNLVLGLEAVLADGTPPPAAAAACRRRARPRGRARGCASCRSGSLGCRPHSSRCCRRSCTSRARRDRAGRDSPRRVRLAAPLAAACRRAPSSSARRVDLLDPGEALERHRDLARLRRRAAREPREAALHDDALARAMAFGEDLATSAVDDGRTTASGAQAFSWLKSTW